MKAKAPPPDRPRGAERHPDGAPSRRPLRVVLVTAEITHVPNNYLSFFETLLDQCPAYVVGLVVLDYVSLQHFADVALLYASGAPRMATTLLANTVSHWRGDKTKLFASKAIPIGNFATMNDERALAWVRALDADLMVNVRTKCIFKEAALSATPLGCLNVHHGLLPEERGILCDLYALAEGKRAGFSIHKMVTKVDAGDVYAVEAVSRPGETNYMHYLRSTGSVEARALAKVLRHIDEERTMPPVVTGSAHRSRWRKLPKTFAEMRAFRRAGIKL